MAKRVLKLLAFLLLGAVTSVGVAWGITIWGVDLVTARTTGVGPKVAWPRKDYPGWMTTYVESRPARGIVLINLETCAGNASTGTFDRVFHGLRTHTESYEVVHRPPRRCHPPGIKPNHREEARIGWPLASMWCGTESHEPRDGSCIVDFGETHHVGRVWPLWCTGSADGGSSVGARCPWWNTERFGGFPRTELYVPTGVLWDGMVGNTVAYAGAWWVVLVAPWSIRRRLRRRRHQCSACGYDRRGIGEAVCPECGVRPGS
ncbi:MAG: hypothetical protein AMXMBFR58_20900 [Phycisphaerae bacterium]